MNYLKNFSLVFTVFCNLIFSSCAFKSIEKENYKWKITFEDNFDTFDNSRWITHHENGERTIWSNNELEFYTDENVKVENGILKLSANKQSILGKDTYGEKQFPFTSGMVCSSKGFLQSYGKWEIKVRFPFKKGFWPAFFLVPIQRPTLPEIDVFEYFGVYKNNITMTEHWGIDYPNSELTSKAPFYNKKAKSIDGDFSDRWMIWEFECFPSNMIWKLDGKKVFESNEGIPTAPLYMIANVAVKDYKENDNKVDETGLPYVMEIDYIKVYQMIPN